VVPSDGTASVRSSTDETGTHDMTRLSKWNRFNNSPDLN